MKNKVSLVAKPCRICGAPRHVTAKWAQKDAMCKRCMAEKRAHGPRWGAHLDRVKAVSHAHVRAQRARAAMKQSGTVSWWADHATGPRDDAAYQATAQAQVSRMRTQDTTPRREE